MTLLNGRLAGDEKDHTVSMLWAVQFVVALGGAALLLGEKRRAKEACEEAIRLAERGATAMSAEKGLRKLASQR